MKTIITLITILLTASAFGQSAFLGGKPKITSMHPFTNHFVVVMGDGTSAVVRNIPPTNVLEMLKAMPNWPVDESGGAGESVTAITYSNLFPNLNKRFSAGLPIRLLCLGDSVAGLTMQELGNQLASYNGRNGGALNGGNPFGNVISSTLVTNKVADGNWWAPHFDIGAGGFVDTTNYLNTIPGGYVWANEVMVLYDGFTNAGGFNISIKTNGGAFAIVQSVSAASTVLTGRVARIPIIAGQYQLRVTGSNLTTKYLGSSLYLTNSPGVRVGFASQSGLTFSALTLVPSSVAVPIMQALAPDVLFLESTGNDPAGTTVAALEGWETTMGDSLTNTDIVYLETPPVDPSWAFDYAAQNLEMWEVASNHNRFFFRQTAISGTYANMLALGLTGDGLHRTPLLDRQFADALVRIISLDPGLKIVDHTNTWNAPQSIVGTLRVSGPSSIFYIEDQATAFLGTYGRMRTLNNTFRIGMETPFANFEPLIFDASYGVATPATLGGAWGRSGLPFTVHNTNSIEYGMGTFNAGTYYPTNVAASLPSAATLGTGGYWIGNSNGVLVSLYSVNGTTTAMKVLVP